MSKVTSKEIISNFVYKLTWEEKTIVLMPAMIVLIILCAIL